MNEYDSENRSAPQNEAIKASEYMAAESKKKTAIAVKAILLAVSAVCSPAVFWFGEWVADFFNADFNSAGIAAAVTVIISSALALAATVVDFNDCKLRERLNAIFSLRSFSAALTVINVLFADFIVIGDIIWVYQAWC